MTTIVKSTIKYEIRQVKKCNDIDCFKMRFAHFQGLIMASMYSDFLEVV